MSVYYRDGSAPTDFDLAIDARLTAFVASKGLKHYAYHVRLVPGEIERDIVVFSSYPQEWVQTFCAGGLLQMDPIVQEAQYHIMPINWDDVDRSDPKIRDLFQRRGVYGVGPRGLTVPIRGAVGDFALFTVTSDENLEAWNQRLPHLVGEVVIMAYGIHTEVMDRWVREDHGTKPLSTRERQVLTLAGQGMPHKSVAFALAISESAVKLYLDSARAKLGASNTAQAVGYAVSRHLIASPPRASNAEVE